MCSRPVLSYSSTEIKRKLCNTDLAISSISPAKCLLSECPRRSSSATQALPQRRSITNRECNIITLLDLPRVLTYLRPTPWTASALRSRRGTWQIAFPEKLSPLLHFLTQLLQEVTLIINEISFSGSLRKWTQAEARKHMFGNSSLAMRSLYLRLRTHMEMRPYPL